jgi:UDP-N-acetylmuramate dehydrogenase
VKILKDYTLQDFNTFGIDAKASKIVCINTINDILFALTAFTGPYKVLGGGSNIILSSNVKDTILKNEIKGIEIIDEDHQQCMVKVGAGENWHFFVLWAVYHNLGGIENLALIPGTVGAAPIQNIGAYGVEQDELFHSCNVIDLESGTLKTFYKSDCKFGYRESVFKHQAKGQYIITDVTYILKKDSKVNTDYKDVSQYLDQHNIDVPTVKDVADAVTQIRTRKLPDPNIIGNAGSFFKNPIISKAKYQDIQTRFPDIPNYPIDEAFVKVPAAWCIDQCGFKGVTAGNTGTYKNQALVIVNRGNATGEEILDFAVSIQSAVSENFDIDLDIEVNVW